MRFTSLVCKLKSSKFIRSEDGVMVIFGLFLFVIILMTAGLAVDFMRYESNRVRVQSTADRAVLAAATLRESGDREGLVREHFEKAGLSAYLVSVDDDSALNSATVTVNTRPGVDTLFMRWSGVDRLASVEVAEAKEEVTQIEIVMVLDISGSMRWNDNTGTPRITRLRGAAREFVSTVLNPVAPDATTISIVPYAGSVNPGQDVFALLGGLAWHNFSHCPDLPRSVFNSIGLPDAGSMPQAPHFMYWAGATGVDWGWCPNESNSILYHSSSESDLHDYLTNLRMHDGTGTHYGMRWGAALLDPSSRWLNQALASSGTIEPEYANRPSEWDDPDTLKVVVLMTDGMITEQFRPRRPQSSIYGRDGIYPTEAEQDQLNASHISPWGGAYRQRISTQGENSSDFDAACTAAKENGIMIYTIAFETNSQGQNEMRRCASNPTNFFNAEGLELASAFRSIAASIQSLRLTQ